MASFEITAPNGKTYEIEGATKEGALAALRKHLEGGAAQGAATQNPDGTYGQPPEGMFENPNTGQMTSRDMLRANAKTGPWRAAGLGYMQGYSFNTADEMLGRAAGAITGDGSQFQTENARAMIEANREAHPGDFLAYEAAGAAMNPANRVMGPAKSVAGAARQGGSSAFGYALGNEEGTIAERANDAKWAIPMGAIFGAGSKLAIDAGSAAFRKLWAREAGRPTVSGLRGVKKAAYKAVDDSGFTFQPNETQALVARIKGSLDDVNYVPEVDKQTFAAIKTLETASERPLTLGQFDRIRQSLWRRHRAAPNEQGILDAIDAIDDFIAQAPDANDLMLAARAANAKYKKAEMLDRAFEKLRDQTASTGSGGNILNKYKQAVTAIKNDPKRAKWFTAEEIAAMDNLINGTFSERQLRRFGKLSPNGNGLMLALNLGAAAVDPASLAVTAGASAAKAVADRSGAKAAEGLLDTVSGYAHPRSPVMPTGAGGAVGSLAEETRNYLRSLER